MDDIDSAGVVDGYVVISNHKFAHHFESWALTKKQDITDTIALLPMADYNTLHKVYIQSLSFKEIASETDYSNVTTAHGRALQRLQKLLDTRTV